ncbi:DUF4037 domain-containing protein [Caviibacter abscessus]|uniref:DUF4037 domain-containing protein n=1 Tax=Caviibacter abscessus TaxID=1766719 RepID=UPI000830E029|nr:DUF4037 domain-containing protein [Caviibacter abscessus]
MTGLELSKKYFEEVLYKKIKENFDIPISAGLIGYGSECYGFDDLISRDHDFYPMPCIWIKEQDYVSNKEKIEKFMETLDDTYMGFKIINKSEWGENRRGFLNINDYIYSFLGSLTGPENDMNFRRIPQYLLSSFTNGEIFVDELGIITEIRNKVKYYPEDIRLNMMATRCMQIHREGLYNYTRCIRRNEYVASTQALGLFITSVIEMYCLINKIYCPYYKWQHKMLKNIEPEIYDLLKKLVLQETTYNAKINIIDEISNKIMEDLKLANSIDLIECAMIIQNKIRNDEIRSLGCWSD